MRIPKLLSMFALLATACGSASESAVQTAIAQTQAAIPTPSPIPTQTPIPTPTPIPLSEIDLETILLVSGDLPPDFVGGQVKSIPPKYLEGGPTADQVIQQGFRAGAFASQGILILLYKSPSDLETAYSTMLERSNNFEPLADIGEKAAIKGGNVDENALIIVGVGAKSTQLVFTRCHALVYIDLYATSASVEVTTTYAQRLDKRLTSLLCP